MVEDKEDEEKEDGEKEDEEKEDGEKEDKEKEDEEKEDEEKEDGEKEDGEKEDEEKEDEEKEDEEKEDKEKEDEEDEQKEDKEKKPESHAHTGTGGDTFTCAWRQLQTWNCGDESRLACQRCPPHHDLLLTPASVTCRILQLMLVSNKHLAAVLVYIYIYIYINTAAKCLFQMCNSLFMIQQLVPVLYKQYCSQFKARKYVFFVYDLVPKGAHARGYALQLKIKHC